MVEADHISYADDHLTIITIRVAIDIGVDRTGKVVEHYAKKVGRMLTKAAELVGCGVNPDKSECVVPLIYVSHVSTRDTKDHFKWLGYYLKLDEEGNLEFMENKVKEKLEQIGRVRDLVYQYTTMLGIRWKIYKTYLAPYIELFLPLAVQKDLKINSLVKDFQHKSICRALGLLNRGVSREEVESLVGEKSVVEKAVRMLKRLIRAEEVDQLRGWDRENGTRWYPCEAGMSGGLLTRGGLRTF